MGSGCCSGPTGSGGGDPAVLRNFPALVPKTARIPNRTLQKFFDHLLGNVKGNNAMLSMGFGGKNDQKRVRMFRGKKLIECLKEERIVKKFKAALGELVGEKEAAGFAATLTDDQAFSVAQKLLNFADEASGSRLFAACDKLKDPKGKESVKLGDDYVVRPLDPESALAQNYDAKNGRYYFTYQGNAAKLRIVMILVIALVLLLCLYPLWPAKARVVVWYVSVTLLLVLLALTVVQLTVFMGGWMVGYSVWIVPNLWADVPVQEIFKPMFTVSKSSPGQALYRLAVFGSLIALGYWVSQQGTGLDEFLEQQKKVVEDLYAGNLLSDTASSPGAGAGAGKAGRMKDRNLGYGKSRRGPNIPSLEELDEMFEEAGYKAAPQAEAGGAAEGAEAGADVVDKVFEASQSEEQSVGADGSSE